MIPCHHCGKMINMGRWDLGGETKGEPYTAIEHYYQPSGHGTEYYFHTKCFLEIAGNEYGPREKIKHDGGTLTAEELAQELIRQKP